MDEKLKVKMNASPWVPLTIVKGGQAANFLVKAMENEWGRKLYSKTLIRNIGLACYKVGRRPVPQGVATWHVVDLHPDHFRGLTLNRTESRLSAASSSNTPTSRPCPQPTLSML